MEGEEAAENDGMTNKVIFSMLEWPQKTPLKQTPFGVYRG
jgi:hypothetical protein